MVIQGVNTHELTYVCDAGDTEDRVIVVSSRSISSNVYQLGITNVAVTSTGAAPSTGLTLNQTLSHTETTHEGSFVRSDKL